MAYVDPNTVSNPTTGQVIPAAWGDQLRDNQEFFIDPPAVSAYHNTTQSVANNTDDYLSCNAENFDNDSMHSTSTNNSRITINTAGRYMVIASIRFAADADGFRQIKFEVNRTTTYESSLVLSSGSSLSTVLTGVRWMTLAASDYVEVICRHLAGAALDVQVYEFAATFQTR